MPFKPGQSGNIKGRPPGARNRDTLELRDRLKSFLEDNFSKFQKDFRKLDVEKRVEFYEKYLKYVLPTLKTTDLTLDFDNMTEGQLDEIITKILERKTK